MKSLDLYIKNVKKHFFGNLLCAEATATINNITNKGDIFTCLENF